MSLCIFGKRSHYHFISDCKCSTKGSVDAQCDDKGQCNCQEGYGGLQCQKSLVGTKVLVTTGAPWNNGRMTEVIDLENPSATRIAAISPLPIAANAAVANTAGCLAKLFNLEPNPPNAPRAAIAKKSPVACKGDTVWRSCSRILDPE